MDAPSLAPRPRPGVSSAAVLEAAAPVLCAAALAAAAAGAASGLLPPAAALLAGGGGLAGLLLDARRRWGARRLALTLAGSGGTLHGALGALAERLRTLEHRTAKTHPVTTLPTRENLLDAVAADLAEGPDSRLLGLVRFADYDRLAAFDQAVADGALRRFALRLADAVDARHLTAQVDRDVFAVWFRSGGGTEAAAAELRALAYVAGQDLTGRDSVITPAVEVGAAAWPADGDDPRRLLARATAALQRPEGADEGEVRLPPAASLDSARETFDLEQGLARAIGEDQLAVVFQPVVDLARGRLIGAEALLRWEHPELGRVSPARFIPLVENLAGLSEQYGLWVLNAACREAARWRDAGLDGMKVAVNISARQLVDPGLLGKVRRTLERHALPASALELELTETAAMADAGRTLHLFGELRAMGVSLAVDDFGSGYSSLSYLKNLPFDKLKIDREFVTKVDQRRDSRAICKALIELGRGLDLVVLAEGVEEIGEVRALRQLGCEVFQGFHFSAPLPPQAFLDLARDPAWRARVAEAAGPQPVRPLCA